MNRTPIVAGNWKMNKTAAEGIALVDALRDELNGITGVDRVVCPPFMAIAPISHVLEGSEVKIGAQNLYWEAQGAYTGEVAPEMVAEFCQYVILGHSERRTYFGDTDETVNKKIKAALAVGLTPIVCIGETLEQNQAGETAQVVSSQALAAFEGLDGETVSEIVIAYEPIWAIGTGLAATAEVANAIIADHIRAPLAEKYGDAVAQAVRVQYGGSVKPGNAAEYFSQPDIDGALVGGASLKVDDFVAIVRAAV